MTDIALTSPMGDDAAPVQPASRPNLDKGFNPLTMILFFGILAAGLLYVAYSIYADIDATGMQALKEFHQKCKRQGTRLLLGGVHAQPLFEFTRVGLDQTLGLENMFENLE